MAKLKITNLHSQFYSLVVSEHNEGMGARGGAFSQWHVEDCASGAQTSISRDMERYREIKKRWRKSKKDFDSICRNMKFRDLFSQ